MLAQWKCVSPKVAGGEGQHMTADENSGSLLKPGRLRTETAVELIGLNKWYGDFHVLRDINLKVRGGERIVICGPSGSGKSTMIRCINRLEEHQGAGNKGGDVHFSRVNTRPA